VQAEQEAAKSQAEGGPGAPGAEGAEAADTAPPPGAELPPPDLTFLASNLYLQAIVSLGQVPDPVSGKAEVRLDHAKHMIDTLDMLQRKTEGNRTPEETKALEYMLHELRLAFVEAGRSQPE
jgi:hypothetical protein